MTLVGARGLHARFRAVADAPGTMMRTLGLAAVHEQKVLAPYRTRNLQRSIHLESWSARQATTVASAHYAAHVEYGTRPHDIRPRRRKVLRFSVGGRVVFTKLVHHPGTRPQPFMVPGARKALDRVGISAIIDAWNRAA